MRVPASKRFLHISVTLVVLGLLGANSVAERGLAAPSGKHAVLVDNIGTYGRKISTASPLAQKFFDQGLRLVYGYYFPEAIARAHLARATAVERALIESLSVRFDNDRYPDRAVRDEKYIEATRSVLDRYTDDLVYCLTQRFTI